MTTDKRANIWPVLHVICGKMKTDHCRQTDGHLTGFTSHLGKDDYKSLYTHWRTLTGFTSHLGRDDYRSLYTHGRTFDRFYKSSWERWLQIIVEWNWGLQLTSWRHTSRDEMGDEWSSRRSYTKVFSCWMNMERGIDFTSVCNVHKYVDTILSMIITLCLKKPDRYD